MRFLALLCFGVAILLTGCASSGQPSSPPSSSTPADPFVGSWQRADGQSDPNSYVVIGKQPDGSYVLTLTFHGATLGSAEFTRRSNRLQNFDASASIPKYLVAMVIVYKGQPGRLLVKYVRGLAYPYVRVNGSTATPTPLSTNSSPDTQL